MSEAPPELSETERIQAHLTQVDILLAQGKAAIERMDRFYREHDLVLGVGEQVLFSEQVPERHRIIFAKIIAELSQIDQRIDELDPFKSKPAPVAVSTRAIGNRYRI
ncbi:hypothetical protein EI77_02767 [Prosthecobacter fusiformis]|uniref:Uncharacterized protein n=1 Tax=Prosthecobacter fusiformis TaxID=48464 RepID=A0A4R7RZ93_9BACT|nr:hypothetical protein [Prosthecobacter fusiformis]TDU70719.1 hypothetical protein EI77_02767 [Prosthecobacter fusiformis]